MADHSSIEWTDATWNPVTGCSVVSPGCTNCYAMALAGTRLRHHESRAGLTRPSKAGPVWTGEVRLNEQWLDQPLRWKRQRMVFVCAHGDLFHESVPDEWIDKVFAVMALAPQHTFQVLTKRAKRMREYAARLDNEPVRDTVRRIVAAWPGNAPVPIAGITFPLPNVWIGVSAERQAEADERIPELLATPAAVRFVSLEPLLGPIDLRSYLRPMIETHYGSYPATTTFIPRLDWVIVGGESGKGARPFDTAWGENIVQQCRPAWVACFVKQLGAHVIQGGERRVKRDKKGGDMSEWPHALRIREMPNVG